MDIYEAIEERSLDLLDNSDFVDTDIPFEIPLPDGPYLRLVYYSVSLKVNNVIEFIKGNDVLY